MKDIDGYVTKDDLYRLISRIKYRFDIVVDNTTCNIIIEAISDMHAADVQSVQHGRWENEHYDELLNCFFANCSECGYESTNKFRIADNHSYCGYCGARMDGEQND